jgi:hypothetical protein
MADSDDAAAVRTMIEKFYKVGGVPVPPNLEINESVTVVFAKMLDKQWSAREEVERHLFRHLGKQQDFSARRAHYAGFLRKLAR